MEDWGGGGSGYILNIASQHSLIENGQFHRLYRIFLKRESYALYLSSTRHLLLYTSSIFFAVCHLSLNLPVKELCALISHSKSAFRSRCILINLTAASRGIRIHPFILPSGYNHRLNHPRIFHSVILDYDRERGREKEVFHLQPGKDPFQRRRC